MIYLIKSLLNLFGMMEFISEGELLSTFLMLLNVSFTAGVMIPQFYKNYRIKSCDGLSYYLILMWLMGSLFSTLSAKFKNSSKVIFFIGMYNIIISCTMFMQMIYYRFYNNPNEIFTKKEKLVSIGCCVLFFIIVIIYFVIKQEQEVILGEIVAWMTMIIYTSSKIPQIYLNWKTNSVSGLSKLSFTFIILGNFCFLFSIVTTGFDIPIKDVLYKNIQWILSSAINIVIDFVIVYQFYIYSHTLNTNFQPAYTNIISTNDIEFNRLDI